MLEAEAGTATGDGAEGDEKPKRPLAAGSDRNKPKVPPKPPAKIAGGSGGKNTKDPQKMSLVEYKAWRAAGGGR